MTIRCLLRHDWGEWLRGSKLVELHLLQRAGHVTHRSVSPVMFYKIWNERSCRRCGSIQVGKALVEPVR